MRLALRLAARDLRKHPAMGLLLLLAMLAATTTFTLALVIRPAAERPWDHTFEATRGPHIVATVYESTEQTDAALENLASAPGIAATAGPFALLTMPGEIEVMARDTAESTVDQPYLTAGTWIRDGGVVMEESLASASKLAPGDRITIAHREFEIVGIAVTAFRQPTPFYTEGLVWATRQDAALLEPSASSRGAVLMARMDDPSAAPAFAAAHGDGEEPYVDDWQSTRFDAITDVQFALFGLIVGAVSLAMLAAASVAVLVSGRMAAQVRRAAVLKAVGATPGYIGVVMLTGYLGVALLAGLLGLMLGAWLTPVLAKPVPGVLDQTASADLTPTVIGLVLGSAIALVALATLLPAVRAARASPVRTLANPARSPRRSRLMIALSARMPAWLLFGLRVASRRPGRTSLSIIGLSVTVAAIVVALWMEAGIAADGGEGIIYDKLRFVAYTFIAALVILAGVNAILVAWTTALANLRAAALARALGATPGQIASGFVAAGTLPALIAVLIGIPIGYAVLSTAQAAAGSQTGSPSPAATALLALLPAMVVLVAALTAIPSLWAARRSVVDALRSD